MVRMSVSKIFCATGKGYYFENIEKQNSFLLPLLLLLKYPFNMTISPQFVRRFIFDLN